MAGKKYWIGSYPDANTNAAGAIVAAKFFDDDIVYDTDPESESFGEALSIPNHEKVEQLLSIAEPLNTGVVYGTNNDATGTFQQAKEDNSGAFNKWQSFIRSSKLAANFAANEAPANTAALAALVDAMFVEAGLMEG